jgi:hypothetical protein
MVGRKLGAPRTLFAKVAVRAGFEPRRADGFFHSLLRNKRRPGSVTISKAAGHAPRLKTGADTLQSGSSPKRAEFFALPSIVPPGKESPSANCFSTGSSTSHFLYRLRVIKKSIACCKYSSFNCVLLVLPASCSS